jgi:hypothetical protein
MPRDNLPPEERLLRLIRGQQKPLAEKAQEGSLPSRQPQQIKPDARRFFSKLSLRIGPKKIILLLFIASSFYLAAVFISPLIYSERIELPQVQAERPAALPQEAKQNKQPLEYYLSAVEGRDIFVKQSSHSGEAVPGAAAADLIKDMSLVGIISGADPQAIIEDKKLLKTYYLRKGQTLGELQVEDIQEGKIIINHNGEKFELYL